MNDIIEIDIIILSYAQTPEFKQMTDQCIQSLINSEDPGTIKFNIIVIESAVDFESYQYRGTKTIYTDKEFGYHKYMNIGIELTSAPYICLCNNDLIFYPHWATEMLTAFNTYNLSSGSPVCPYHHPGVNIDLNSGVHLGYKVRQEISGWCIFIKRELLKKTGKLDENYKFWCSDNDYANTLFMLGITHGLVTSSIVDHLESRTLSSQPIEKQQSYVDEDLVYFGKKWNSRLGYAGWSVLAEGEQN
ncbi:glycosyltransferase family 2 protein [Pedobacter lusitanus]|uniref:glycosyltransferase family 2 protein n=1 Tax=Pedobacter lusitanus TaxID=1503925 RepID=UPI000696F01A|nr:glycosyltransferase [Pedobacter lusitanus]